MSAIQTYRSQDGRHLFQFRFVQQGEYYDIYCLSHPSLNGRDDDPHKTHLFHSGKICFVSGREPADADRAQELAAQWAEYFINYLRIGTVQR